MATVKILNSSMSVEWFTPARYADAARAVLGGIELDPASCAEANETIQAERYFSADGLAQSWAARSVFVNPPYGTLAGKSNQALWSRNLITSYKTQLTKSAILLVNASTSEKWWQPLWEFPICFPDHRIKYDYPKLRRFARESVTGNHNRELRKQLAKKPVRIWVSGTGGKSGAWRCGRPLLTKDESQALVMPFEQAYGYDDHFAAQQIHFDLMDKPSQPTKAQAFIYFGPNLFTFGKTFAQFGPIVETLSVRRAFFISARRKAAA